MAELGQLGLSTHLLIKLLQYIWNVSKHYDVKTNESVFDPVLSNELFKRTGSLK